MAGARYRGRHDRHTRPRSPSGWAAGCWSAASRPGDQVKEGDVVATLDPAPYQAEVDSVNATLERVRAASKNAASQLERDRQLFEKDIVAKARLETSEANAQQAFAEVRSLEATLERRKLDLGFTVLHAPFGGVISAVFAEVFEEIKAQQPVMRIIDPDKIEMIVNVVGDDDQECHRAAR